MLEYLLSQDKSVGLELLEPLLPLLQESQPPMDGHLGCKLALFI